MKINQTPFLLLSLTQEIYWAVPELFRRFQSYIGGSWAKTSKNEQIVEVIGGTKVFFLFKNI